MKQTFSSIAIILFVTACGGEETQPLEEAYGAQTAMPGGGGGGGPMCSEAPNYCSNLVPRTQCYRVPTMTGFAVVCQTTYSDGFDCTWSSGGPLGTVTGQCSCNVDPNTGACTFDCYSSRGGHVSGEC